MVALREKTTRNGNRGDGPEPPRYYEEDKPNSSRSTSECLVAWCRMLAVSLSSTKKVLSPKEDRDDARLEVTAVVAAALTELRHSG